MFLLVLGDGEGSILRGPAVARTSAEWTQVMQFQPVDRTNGTKFDQFGNSVALHESRAVIGTRVGYVAYVFEHLDDNNTNSFWTLTSEFIHSNEAHPGSGLKCGFGGSVTTEGNCIVGGASYVTIQLVELMQV